MEGAQFHHAGLHDVERTGERVALAFSVFKELVHARAGLCQQGAHGPPRIALDGELAARRGVFGEPFTESRQTLYQRSIPVDRRARPQNRQGGLQLLVELLRALLEVIARGACFVERGERFAQGAQLHGDAPHPARVAFGDEPSQ